MKCIVFFSGGIGSWVSALRVAHQYGAEDLTLLFTDTLIEDQDLYRFLLEGAAEVFGVRREKLRSLLDAVEMLPEIECDISVRKEILLKVIHPFSRRLIPGLEMIADGRTPWEIFYDVKFLGNSRIDPCSRILKRELSRDWIDSRFQPDETVLYIGIDWTEEHRLKAASKNWEPYKLEAPMCSSPYLMKQDMLDMLKFYDIEIPRLYKMGFPHNNWSKVPQ